MLESVKVVLRLLLTDDEFTYVMAYYGLNDGNRVDVDEIANAAGLSKSRIQSSVNFAMEKLCLGSESGR